VRVVGWFAAALHSFFGVMRSQKADASRRLGLDDVRHMETSFPVLMQLGMELRPELINSIPVTAKEITHKLNGTLLPSEPTAGDWALFVLAHGVFSNAIYYGGECTDDFTLENYSKMILDVISIAGEKWPVDDVVVADGNAHGPARQRSLVVTIKDGRETAPFELVVDGQCFDWSIIAELNARLPNPVVQRFAVFADGDFQIVFLTPEKIKKLSAVCGYPFEGDGQRFART
jgi:hypothetical protein